VGDEIEPAVMNEINRFELFADGRVASIDLARPDLIVERAKVIDILAAKALDAGARVSYGTRFLGISEGSGGIEVSLTSDKESRTVTAPIVVGADGTNSKVARAAGWPEQPTVPLVQAIVKMPSDLASDTTRVWFRPQDTPYFYWLVPESPSRAALGVIGEDGAATRRRLDRFLDEHDLKAISYQGAKIPAYQRWIPVHERLGSGDVYLVGDAAGQVKVSTVGGLVTGLRGASAVAGSILNGNGARELSSLRRELNIHLLIRRAMHRFTQDDYCYILDRLNDPARRSLGANDRDDASKILWSLCLSRPQLLLKGIRSLITGTATTP
jgi:flavin-dependent dehydrogenase